MNVIYYQLRADIQKIIKDLCKWKGIEIVERHMMSDYVHQYLVCNRRSNEFIFFHFYCAPIIFICPVEVLLRIWFFGTISCKSASKTCNLFSYTTSTEKYY